MAIEDLHQFISQVKEEPTLKQAITQADEQKLPTVICELAQASGLSVDPADVQQWMQPPASANDELQEAQLDAVSGGASFLIFNQSSPSLRNLEQNFGLFAPSHPQPTWPGNLP